MTDPWMSGLEFWRLFAVAAVALLSPGLLLVVWERRPRRVRLYPVPNPYREGRR